MNSDHNFARNSLNFGSTTKYITIPDAANLSFGTGSPGTDTAFTIEGWFFLHDATDFPFFTKGATANREYYLFCVGDAIRFGITNPGSTKTIEVSMSGTITEFENTWVHICATYDGSKTAAGMKVFTSARPRSTTTGTIGVYDGMTNTATDCTVGRRFTDVAVYGNGMVRRVSIFNTNLTNKEIREVMNLADLNYHSQKDNLVSWWEIDNAKTGSGEIKDRRGSNNATYTNGADADRLPVVPFPRRYQTVKSRQSPLGEFGGFSTNFNGANQYLGRTGFSVHNYAQATMSCWFRSVGGGGFVRYIFNCPRLSGSAAGMGFYLNTSGVLIANIDTGANTDLNSGWDCSTNEWLHVCETYDGVNAKLYLNGQEVATAAKTGNIRATDNETYVGRFGTGGYYHIGDIADPIIFNRGLTAAEVLQIYNNHTPRDEMFNNLSGDIVAYWRAYDSSIGANLILDQKNSNHLTATNMDGTNFYHPYPKAITASSQAGSFQFDGVNEYVTIPSSSSLQFSGGGVDTAFSISVYASMIDATNFSFLSKRAVWEFACDPSDLLKLICYTSGSIYIGRSSSAMTTKQSKWTHFCCTYSGGENNSSIRLYADGVRVDNADTSAGVYTGMPTDSTVVTLGALSNAPLRPANGFISNVTVWNKELSGAEVEELYNGGSPVDITKLGFYSNAVSWWKMDQTDSPTTANGVSDEVGSNEGTGVNMEAGDLQTGPRRFPTN